MVRCLKTITLSAFLLMPAYGYAEGTQQSESPTIKTEDAKTQESSANKGFVISGDVGFVSDYVYRGQTFTFGGPAVQGEMIISQKKEEGFYAGIWGSNVDSTTATNGPGVEIDLTTGYIYKPKEDLSLKLELLYSWYPGAYAPLETKDKFDQLELVPSITYKYFTVLWAYCFTNIRGINEHFVEDFVNPLIPNGNTKGSWYTEASMKLPIPGTQDKLKFLLSAGYWRVQNHRMLNYSVFTTGLSYTLPERWAGLVLFASASTTNAQKKYYTVVNESGQSKNLVAPKFWVGVTKEF